MELKVEHLSPYLPYKLKLQYVVRDVVKSIGTMKSIYHSEDENHPTRVSIDYRDEENIWMFKPMLRSLSNLDKEIEHNGEKFIPIDWFEEKYPTLSLHKECERLLEQDGHRWLNHMSYLLVIHLLEFHFDIFGLISSGIATEI
jgi:hypothetical protein